MGRALPVVLGLFVLALPHYAQRQAQQEWTADQEQAAARAVALLDGSLASIPDQDPATLRLMLVYLPMAYGRAEQPEKGRATVHRLLTALKGTEPSAPNIRDSFESVAVLHLSNLGFPADAAEVAASISDEDYRWPAMATVVYGYARAGDLASARRIAAAIPQTSSRDRAYEYIVYECSRLADLACASAAADSMTDTGMKARTLSLAARIKTQKGRTAEAAADLEQARSIAEELPDSDPPGSYRSFPGCLLSTYPSARDSSLQQVAESQAGAGELDAARETLRQIRAVEVRDNALVVLARAEVRKGALTTALSLAGEISRTECRSQVLSNIALRRFSAGDTAAAWQTLNQIPAPETRAFTLLNFAETRRARQGAIAQSTLAKAAETALQVADSAERLNLLLSIANRQIKAGLTEQARPTLLSARIAANDRPLDTTNTRPSPGRNPIRRTRNWHTLLASLAELLAETGEITSGAEVGRQIGASLRYPAARLGRGAARGGHADSALAWAASLATAQERILAQIGIAIGILDRAGIGYTPDAAVW